MSTQHTSTPWRIVEGRIIKQDYRHIGLGESAGVQIGSVCGHPASGFYPTEEEAAANVAFIVKAVNTHESLVYALQMARGHITAPVLSTPDLLRIVNAALAAAEGK